MIVLNDSIEWNEWIERTNEMNDVIEWTWLLGLILLDEFNEWIERIEWIVPLFLVVNWI